MHVAKQGSGSGGRDVSMLHAVPSCMFLLQSICKDIANLLSQKVLKSKFVRLIKKDCGAIFPGKQAQIFKIKIALKPFKIIRE